MGVDLSGLGSYLGDYENDLTDREYQAISPVISCTSADMVYLSFMRWLNVEDSVNDHAYIDVHDGTDWYNIWSNTHVGDSAWAFKQFNITTVAANKPVVQIRFSMGTTDSVWTYSGWNIDSLTVSKMLLPEFYNTSWIGAQDNNWNNPLNWSHGQIPDTNYNITIPAFFPGSNSPETFSDSSNSINRLIIEQGATLSIPSGNTLIINKEP